MYKIGNQSCEQTFFSKPLQLKIRKLGHELSDMIMPNIGVFVTSGLLSLLMSLTKGALQRTLIDVHQFMISSLLPILIGYTGGKLKAKNNQGGVVGAISTVGLIIYLPELAIIGALILGPLAGVLFFYSQRYYESKIRFGYEMLVKNFLVGLVGISCCLIGIFMLAPTLKQVGDYSTYFISWLIQHRLLAMTNLFIEPLKVFFFNNAINHGVLTPIGIIDTNKLGASTLFLLETNPGPGLGILLAFVVNGSVFSKSARSASLIQLIGGIHEVYFPFVLKDFRLFFAIILGGMSGTFCFTLFDVGLYGPVSPGSMITLLINTPLGKMIFLILGICVSTCVSFLTAMVIIKLKKEHVSSLEGDEGSGLMGNGEKISQIIFACDAGMGSSAMGASLLKKYLNHENREITVSYTSIYKLKNDPNTLVVVQKELEKTVKKQVPQVTLLSISNFLEINDYHEKIKEILANNVSKPPSAIITKKEKDFEIEDLTVSFLYKGESRGSQTMGITMLKEQAYKYNKRITIKKEKIETLVLREKTLYLISPKLFHQYKDQLQEYPSVIVVNHFVKTSIYEQIVKGGASNAIIKQRKNIVNRTS